MSSSSLFAAITGIAVALCVGAHVLGAQRLIEDFVTRECSTTSEAQWDQVMWKTEAVFGGTSASFPVMPISMKSLKDWKCAIAPWFSSPLYSSASSASSSSSQESSPFFSFSSMIIALLVVTAVISSKPQPLLLFFGATCVFPTLRTPPMEAFALLSLITQTVAGSGVAANAPRSFVTLSSLGAVAVWIVYLASDEAAAAIGLNPVLWSAVPLALLLQAVTGLAARRIVIVSLSVVASAGAAFLAYSVFVLHSGSAAAILHRMRLYAGSIDARVSATTTSSGGGKEIPWLPGSMLGELLAYGFRSSAPSTILFASMLPCALVLVGATRLRMSFETCFVVCAVCDPRATLAHFIIVAVLMQRRQQPEQSAVIAGVEEKKNKSRDRVVARALRLFTSIVAVFSAIVSLSYFAAWAVYRSMEQNFSLYALFGVHLMIVSWVLVDLEPPLSK